MGLVKWLFRQNKELGSWEEENLRQVIRSHRPDWIEDCCTCGRQVRPGEYDKFMDHVSAMILLQGRRMGPRFWE